MPSSCCRYAAVSYTHLDVYKRQVLTRRWPSVRLLLCPVTVQGFEAAQQVADAIKKLDQRKEVDEIIVEMCIRDRLQGLPGQELWQPYLEKAPQSAESFAKDPLKSLLVLLPGSPEMCIRDRFAI